MLSRNIHIAIVLISGVLLVCAIYLFVSVLFGTGIYHQIYGAHLFRIGFLLAFMPMGVEIWRNRHKGIKDWPWDKADSSKELFGRTFNFVLPIYAVVFFLWFFFVRN